MNEPGSNYYVTGGSLRSDTASYIQRNADRELFDALQHGEFCYILTARQMGKSSLMVRTTALLRAEGVRVAVLDLTAIGQNLVAEQWYYGLLGRLGEQLGLEDELDAFWLERQALGPLRRFMAALRQVALVRCIDRIVLFIDEIDVVRSLPFSTDEFFAAIRECYNRRTEDPEFTRLTFCLLGVAAPTDLIRNTRLTPFNIGKRIELSDFTSEEATPLAAGLHHEQRKCCVERLLHRILHWTGGHPYLTQRLCLAVATNVGANTATDVDRLCSGLFLSHRAQDRDDNLIFVRERILRTEADLAAVLDLYGRVRKGERVQDDDTNGLVSLLRLSGIARAQGGCMHVRNRIYERVFDRRWVLAHMPDADVRRQHAAFRQGVLRTLAASVLVIAVLTAFVLTAMRSAQDAKTALNVAKRAEQSERGERRLADANLYVAKMNLAQQASQVGDFAEAAKLLESQRPAANREDLRGFEWRNLWRRCNGDAIVTLHGHSGAVAFSPDGKYLAAGGPGNTVKLWDVGLRRDVATLTGHNRPICALAFSRDGKTLASCSFEKSIKLWDVALRRERTTLTGDTDLVFTVAFSPDSKTLACGSWDNTIKLWDLATGRVVKTLRPIEPGTTIVFSPDGKTLAWLRGASAARVQLREIATGRESAFIPDAGGYLAYAPNGKTLALTSASRSAVILWDVMGKRKVGVVKGSEYDVLTVAFSPDSKTLATGGADGVLRIWDVASRREVAMHTGHQAAIESVAFSPDGKTLVTVADQTAIVWSLGMKRPRREPAALPEYQECVTFSPDGMTLAAQGANSTVRLWSILTQHEVGVFKGHTGRINSMEFSPDATLLATGSADKTARLWDVVSGREVKRFTGNSGTGQVAFSPNGRILAIARDDDTIQLWDVISKRNVAILTFNDHLNRIAFSPDSKTLAIGHFYGAVQLWDMRAARVISTFQALKGYMSNLAFSHDGRTLAAVSWSGEVSLYDAATLRLSTFRGHAWAAVAVAFSPDDRTLVTQGQDSSVILWSVASQQVVATFRNPRVDGPWSLAFSPTGNMLASADAGAVRLWRAAPFSETDAQR